MFFILSKTLALLLLPSNFLIAIGIVGVALLLTRWRRAGTTAVNRIETDMRRLLADRGRP